MRELKPVTSEINKLLYYFMLLLLTFVMIFMSNTQNLNSFNFKIKFNVSKRSNVKVPVSDKCTNETRVTQVSKYILLWTSDTASPFIYFGKGNSVFVNKKCKWTNCIVTSDRNYLGYYTEFDVIAFNGPQLRDIVSLGDYPSKRSARQKYVFANIEAVSNYPIDTSIWNDFFNWTWTYKLNSDAIWGYLAIRNATNHVVGPRADMHWLSFNDMQPIDDILKQKLKSKSKAAAWFSSNCFTKSKREDLVKRIQTELHKYDLDVDIYGACGKHQCPREIMDRCLKVLQKNYYFYFAFENALSEDYVTEKIVYALNHYTVPVVFGGANYSRFMPPGSYLNALDLSPEALAEKMDEIIRNPELFYNYFRWKKHYSYHFRNESPLTDDYCRFCSILNDDHLMKSTTVYGNFTSWWTESNVPIEKYAEDSTSVTEAQDNGFMFIEPSDDRYGAYLV